MILLEYHNTFVKIKGANKLHIKMISDLLSFEIDSADHIKRNMNRPYMNWDGRKRLLDRRSMTFPAGLAGQVVRFLNDEKAPFKIVDRRKRPISTSKLPILPTELVARDYQLDIRTVNQKYSRGITVLGTGGGKTITAGLTISDRAVDTLFVTPDSGLRTQTLKVFKWMFGRDVVDTEPSSGKPIIVSNIQALARKEVRDLERFKMLYIDEFHHSASSSYLKLSWMTAMAYYRYGLTGTFVRPDGNDMIMWGVLDKVTYKKTASELIKDGWLVQPHITIYRYQVKGWSRLNYRDAYDRMTNDRGFNDLIATIANRKIDEKKQTIILVRRKEHGALLASMIPRAVYISGSDKVTYRDQVKSDFNNRIIPCIIATSVMGEGQDIPNIDVLINARLEESEIQTKQGIGRALRLADGAKDFEHSKILGKELCEVYDFLIIGQKHLKSHSVSRMKNYRSEPGFRMKVLRAN